MMQVLTVFSVISTILFFGFLAEFLFKRTNIPDVFLLIVLGLVLGKYGLGVVSPTDIGTLAPVFISFTLLFLLYDGAFKIDIASFTKEFSAGIKITLFNFFLSATAVTLVFVLFGNGLLLSLLAGFTLGGISSAFVLPLLKQLNVSKRVYSLLTIESAFTDVLCIVLALATIDLIVVGTFSAQSVATTIVSLFAVAGFIGAIAGVLWVFVLTHILGKNAMNMMTIAFLLAVYVLTEYLHGNGAIACLVFGLVLKNSLELRNLLRSLLGRDKIKHKHKNTSVGISVTSANEEAFYHEVAFFVKTLFFVYIGILIDFSNLWAVLLGFCCAIAILLARIASKYATKGLRQDEQRLVIAMFARGLAPAVIVQIALQRSVPNAAFLSQVVMVFILGTIVFSSVRVFFYRESLSKQAPR